MLVRSHQWKQIFFDHPPTQSCSTLDFFLAFFLPFCPAFLSATLPCFVPLSKALGVKEGKNPLFISAQPPKRINILDKKGNLNKYISIDYLKKSQKTFPGVA